MLALIHDGRVLMTCPGDDTDALYADAASMGLTPGEVEVREPTTAELDLHRNGAPETRVRAERDRRIQAVAWRIERHVSETRQGVPAAETTDDITALDAYVQALRDLPEQPGFPDAVDWPVEP